MTRRHTSEQQRGLARTRPVTRGDMALSQQWEDAAEWLPAVGLTTNVVLVTVAAEVDQPHIRA